MYKSIAYAYPTSIYARQLGRWHEGCYMIETASGRFDPPESIHGPYDTLEEAIEALKGFDGTRGPFCMSRKANRPNRDS